MRKDVASGKFMQDMESRVGVAMTCKKSRTIVYSLIAAMILPFGPMIAASTQGDDDAEVAGNAIDDMNLSAYEELNRKR